MAANRLEAMLVRAPIWPCDTRRTPSTVTSTTIHVASGPQRHHRNASAQRSIPIEIAAPTEPASRDFVPWRFSDAGPERGANSSPAGVRETLYEGQEVKHHVRRGDDFLHFAAAHFLVRPLRSFPRPGHIARRSARAGAVKSGRRSADATRSALSRPYLDGPEHDGSMDLPGEQHFAFESCASSRERR
jgi:hypothetical protein